MHDAALSHGLTPGHHCYRGSTYHVETARIHVPIEVVHVTFMIDQIAIPVPE